MSPDGRWIFRPAGVRVLGARRNLGLHWRRLHLADKKSQRFLLALLAFLLLFAQQAAYAHAVTHLGKEPPPKEQLGHAQLCGKCISFDKFSSAAPASIAPLLSLTVNYAQPAEPRHFFRPVTVAAFNSRAPPVFL